MDRDRTVESPEPVPTTGPALCRHQWTQLTPEQAQCQTCGLTVPTVPATSDNEGDSPLPQRLHRRHFRDRMPGGSVGCARPSTFGNPFTVAVHGRAAACVALFETAYVADRVFRAEVIRVLRGKDLWCYCALNASCHVDVLLRWANEETPLCAAKP